MATEQSLEELFASAARTCREDDELQTHLQYRLSHGVVLPLQRFSHVRLKSTGTIRLLTLLPGSLQDEIRCSLSKGELLSRREFTALSYTWGDPSECLPIDCNKKQALITINLYSALLRLRHRHQKRLFWIDALCIDQSMNPDALRERTLQVRMMGDIYSQASDVIIDLGGIGQHHAEVLLRGFYYFCTADFKFFGKVVLDKEGVDDDYGPAHPFWSHWYRFIRRPWFTRVWVLQEYALARSVTILLGAHKIDPDNLRYIMNQAVNQQLLTMPDPVHRYKSGLVIPCESVDDTAWVKRTTSTFQHISAIRHEFCQRGRKADIAELLDMGRNLDASDKRDHLFALAGLVANWSSFDITIDYALDEAAVSKQLVMALARHGHALYCLSRARGIGVEGPSWAPPLYVDSVDVSQHYNWDATFMGLEHWPYSAAGSTTQSMSLIDAKDGLLAVRGFQIDQVVSFADPFPAGFQRVKKAADFMPYAKSYAPWYASTRAWAQNVFPDWPVNHLQDSVQRTLLLNVMRDMSVWPTNVHFDPSSTHLDRFFQFVEQGLQFDPLSEEMASIMHDPNIAQMWGDLGRVCSNRKVCQTGQGRLAHVPQKTTRDNEIWILLGVSVPVVLRRLEGVHVLVGPCYVHDMMDGKALDLTDRHDETIHLK